ncbi:MAG: CCA tRNA nucleotidyltransferase [Candidatus Thermoplasmatota archaeon]|nr:CCA tRNA nucleotidyltransferase [Candidatus Thermoplasmatota archaeon]
MNQFKSIEKQVLDQITPSSSDRQKLQKTITSITEQVNNKLTARKQKALVELVGSTAKDTYLKNNLDIDLFIIFPRPTTKETIAQTTLQIGRKLLNNTEECYAEHPYIRGDFLHYKVELVPCYQITDASEKISAVDRTPLHTQYVKNHLQEKQKQDVRLLKQFLTGIHCYGAEAEIQGLSGYLCELLVIKYESFHQLLTHVQHWKEGIQLTLTSHEIPDFEDPLIFIDPVDKDRNVAAAVAPHTFQRFINASKEYLQQPKKTFFFPLSTKPWSLEQIKKTLQKQQVSYLGIRFTKPNIINENLYPQVRKACTAIKKASEEEAFTIHDCRFHINSKSDKIYIIIKTDEKPLSETYTHMGPPVKLKKNTKEFTEKWKNHPAAIKKPFQKNGRSYVTVKRKYRHLKNYLQDNLTELSLGKHIDPIVRKEFKLLSQSELLISELRLFWTEYLEDKKPWER